jgi:hypothetical protein
MTFEEGQARQKTMAETGVCDLRLPGRRGYWRQLESIPPKEAP